MAVVIVIVIVLAALLVSASGLWVAVGLVATLAAPRGRTDRDPCDRALRRRKTARRGE